MVLGAKPNCYLLHKKKVSQYLVDFDNSSTLQKIAWLKFFFHKDMAKKSLVEIEKEWAQLCFCLKNGGINATIAND